jgi:hypothetical protein
MVAIKVLSRLIRLPSMLCVIRSQSTCSDTLSKHTSLRYAELGATWRWPQPCVRPSEVRHEARARSSAHSDHS